MKGYYYCSLDTFLNIVKTKTIFLSDPLKMNDAQEIKWYLNKINDTELFERISMRAGIELTCDDLLRSLEERGQHSIFISCFSQNPDLLSQWRAYANDGQGVAIGFHLDKLKKADNFFLDEIIYTDNVDDDPSHIENPAEIVADTIGTVYKELNITDRQEQIDVFLHELIPVMGKYKNPAFKEEAEIRLMYCDDLKFEKILSEFNAFTEPFNVLEFEHDFRTSGSNDITEFIKLPFDPEDIADIVIGPKCSLTVNNVKNIVKQKIGIDTQVTKSSASYR